MTCWFSRYVALPETDYIAPENRPAQKEIDQSSKQQFAGVMLVSDWQEAHLMRVYGIYIFFQGFAWSNWRFRLVSYP